MYYKLLLFYFKKISTVTLASKDGENTATLNLYYSSHNWDIKNYEKPDFSLFCFTNTFSLSWETISKENTENNNNENNSTTTTTETTETKVEEENGTEKKPETQKKILMTGTIDGNFFSKN